MKSNVRVLGIDDGPFRRGVDSETCITGVVMRLDGTVEAIKVEPLKVDDPNALECVIDLIPEKSKSMIRAVVSEGVTFGGFGLIDPETFYQRTGIPFISITKGKADIEAMKRALDEHHNMNPQAVALLERLHPVQMEINGTRFTLNFHGITGKEAMFILKRLMKNGHVPEPVRLAHMISSAVCLYAAADVKKF